MSLRYLLKELYSVVGGGIRCHTDGSKPCGHRDILETGQSSVRGVARNLRRKFLSGLEKLKFMKKKVGGDKNMESITMDNLIVNPEVGSFSEAFGVSRKRGDELVQNVRKALDSLGATKPAFTADDFFQAVSKYKVSPGREMLFVVFLIGRHLGEHAVYTDAAKKMEALELILKSKIAEASKDKKYVN